MDILILNYIKRNTVKQSEISIFCIHEKREYACSNLRKLKRKFFVLIKCIFVYL